MPRGAFVSQWRANGHRRATPVVKWAQASFRQILRTTLRIYEQ